MSGNVKKLFMSPPLPFNGNKRNWVSHVLKQFENYAIPEDVVIVDLFGGSGLLAHVFAYMYPNNKVIYNDYDNYIELLNQEVIDKINEITSWGREFMKENGINKESKIDMDLKEIILDKFKEILGENWEENEKLKNIICANFCFSGRNNFNGFLYNKITTKVYLPNFEISDYILPNMEVVHKDYKELLNDLVDLKLKPEKYLFVLDPPYLSTSKSFYKGERHKDIDKKGKSVYWGIEKTCDVLDICLEYKTLLFESDRSEILPLIKIIEKYCGETNEKEINYKISPQRKLGARSNSNDYYIIFNFDGLEMYVSNEKIKKTKETISKELQNAKEMDEEEKMELYLRLKEELKL